MNGEELAVLRLGPVNGPAAQMGGRHATDM